jgi:hypothetical protein
MFICKTSEGWLVGYVISFSDNHSTYKVMMLNFSVPDLDRTVSGSGHFIMILQNRFCFEQKFVRPFSFKLYKLSLRKHLIPEKGPFLLECELNLFCGIIPNYPIIIMFLINVCKNVANFCRKLLCHTKRLFIRVYLIY